MARRHVKVPKRIAGIKVPKQMHKGALGAFLASSGGQVIVAELLLVLAGVLATVANPATRTGRDLRAALTDGARALYSTNGKGGKKRARQRGTLVGYAVERALDAFQGTIASAVEHPADVADVPAALEEVTPAVEAGKKKRRTSRSYVRH